MRPLAVDLVLLRSTAPDLPLVVGRVLAARVVERHGQHGVLNLAGAYLTAELPDEVQAGDRLRLVVQETTGERAVLALAQEPPSPAQVPPPLAAAATAGTASSCSPARARAAPTESGHTSSRCASRGARSGRSSCAWRSTTSWSMRSSRSGTDRGWSLRVSAPGTLRAVLAQAAGRQAEVEVVARPNPLDVYV